MNSKTKRKWEYHEKGDYHKNLDPNWSFTPTYLKKMKFINQFLDLMPLKTKILDAGCGEGVLVEKYSNEGRNIIGLDLNYESEYVMQGNILSTPFKDDEFDLVLLLDVFEHLSYDDQPKCLDEIKRILKSNGYFLCSVHNLAHLNSRFNLFFRGYLDRSDIETNHPGERPIWENIKIIENAGFDIIQKKGVTFTFPILYRQIICKNPARFKWLHDYLNMFASPSLSLLNIYVAKLK